MKITFLLNAKVRFTQERLSLLTPRDRQGLAGRIGVVQTDGNVVRQPTVYFAADGAKQELRLFRVEPRHIELVESSPRSKTALSEEGKPASESRNESTSAQERTPDSNDKLSQSDMDALFD